MELYYNGGVCIRKDNNKKKNTRLYSFILLYNNYLLI